MAVSTDTIASNRPCQAKVKINGIMRVWASMMNEVNKARAANRIMAWLYKPREAIPIRLASRFQHYVGEHGKQREHQGETEKLRHAEQPHFGEYRFPHH